MSSYLIRVIVLLAIKSIKERMQGNIMHEKEKELGHAPYAEKCTQNGIKTKNFVRNAMKK